MRMVPAGGAATRQSGVGESRPQKKYSYPI